MNPFHLTGAEAILATLIVCLTVVWCVWLFTGTVTECTRTICNAVNNFNDAVQNVAKDISDAVVTIYSGKAK